MSFAHHNGFAYTDKYFDDVYEYRHIHVPKDKEHLLNKEVLMTEDEWRALGIAQSQGWQHYMWHRPDPCVLLFRRPKNYAQQQAAAQSKAAQAAQ